MGYLEKITRGRQPSPVLALVYGTDGVGKSTFGADAPRPIFLGAEQGTNQLDVERFPTPAGWDESMGQLEELRTQKHEYRTVVIDSLDWLEPMNWAHLCRVYHCDSIEQVMGGYGKGFTESLKLWQRMKDALRRLREERKMNVVLIAHSHVKKFQDPQTNGEWDRYQLKLNDKAAAFWREFVDAVLFASYDVVVSKEKGASKSKAFGEGSRVMYTESRPAHDAKNRFGLPYKMPLSWAAFEAAVKKHEERTPEVVAAAILELLALVEDMELRAKAEAATNDAGTNVRMLLAIERRLREVTTK